MGIEPVCAQDVGEASVQFPQASVPCGARVDCAMEGRMLRLVVAATLVDRHSCLLEPL